MSQPSSKQQTSLTHQNQLLQSLVERKQQHTLRLQELAGQRESQTERIRQKYAGERQQISHRTLLQKDETENAYQRHLLDARNELALQFQRAQNEFDEKLAGGQQAAKTAKSDGEYDWFLSKQRLQKEYKADKLATKDAYQKKKQRFKAYGAKYSELVSLTKGVLQRHRCEFKVQGGDLLEDPGESDHLKEHLESYQQVEELVRQFRRNFWVRFQEDRWYLIAFMIGIVASVYPLQMAIGNYTISGIAAGVVGLLIAIAAFFISRSMATRVGEQFKPSLVTAVANGKKQLLSAQHQNKQRRDAQFDRLQKDAKNRAEELDADWQATLQEIDDRSQARSDELSSWLEKQKASVEQQRTDRQGAIDANFQPRLNDLQLHVEAESARLSDAEAREVDKLTREIDLQAEEANSNWREHSAALFNELSKIRSSAELSRVSLDELSDWNAPSEPLDCIRFGEVVPDLDNTSPNDDSPLCLPATVDLLHDPSLLIETNSQGQSLATQTLKTAMLRMLMSIPFGKVRFTLVDAVGLGQDFSAFMHLADHDEQIVNHRIWTEPAHINARLSELTQHMENVIQTYLRNEFESIQQYNQQAGEVAEPFRVLVVANFPVGFSDEAASRLLSVVKSGSRCGVFTLISFDPTQNMPRNFDIEDLRANGNVLIANEDLRWSESPLREHAIELDPLPNETVFSKIMHEVGQKSKDANRVEVPFSSVSPAPTDWWQADGRGELSVALGRAGAMKLQSLQLGHGTSQHVLISGKTGSGKSTLLHAIITNLSLKYSPSEVQFYLIDFKKGVEFKAYAEHQLPHARVIAIESEREFGQSVLQRLDSELRRRGDLFRRVGVQSLAGYRDARPDEHLPRILLIIDEFQEFFVKEDKIAQDASLLLDRLVRQGRAFGIHVILGSQTLAGAYSLTRATIGQMAVRVALQCSAADAHLILSDDNDAARLLRRPGEAIYNDANGMVEGNHPFQVVWLSDLEKENLLRELAAKHRQSDNVLDAPIVFEGNTAAEVGKNEQLHKAWESPAPEEVPLAPRAWLGEAVEIKEAPATVFHRRSGANLLLVGQQEEAALGVMASSLISLAAFSPHAKSDRTKFVVLDGSRPEADTAGYWDQLAETTGIELNVIKPRDALQTIEEIAQAVQDRTDNDSDGRAATFLFVYNLARFRDLQKSDDDFGFGGGFGEEKSASPAEQLAEILRNGPVRGVHTILWSDTHTNLMRWIDRQSLRDIESRVLFQMSSSDSSNLMDSSAASQLGMHRAIYYTDDQGRAERFRPYGIPDDDFLLHIRGLQMRPGSSSDQAKRQVD